MIVSLLLLLLLFLLVGVPTAYALAASAIVVIWLEGIPLTIAVQRMTAGVQSFPLLAIPLFILAGTLMNASGISERLFALTGALVGHIRGGMAYVNVLTNVFMSGISGSSLADCAATTRVFVPQMIRHGYDKGFSVGLTASAAVLAPIIPPSILLVIYGWQANVSIGDLFVAGIVPGLVIAAALVATVAIITRRRGFGRGAPFSAYQLRRTLLEASWALLMPVIIIVGFRMGIFTATEVAAIAAAYAFLVGLVVYRTLRITELPRVFSSAARDTSSILVIAATAAPFGWILSIGQAPQQLLSLLTGFSDNPMLILLLINIILLVLGTFMETLVLIIILVPILLPLIQTLGIDPVHFGIVMIINLVIGQLTPPLGVLMYVTCGISGTSIGQFMRAIRPFLIALIIALLAITYIPALALYPTALLR
ncbi:TRAP transporter large permease [Nitratireductor pacificus]|uniref:TRAP transporter large permease protein n=1 Tax=Nitratireductor pacificus pht-3B TaxID=391937 RepID=K2ME35_9HYPH|nr:TRAP transporter large permease [Nitratireductor pacificus]EKF20441.1 C4-dicarboxylate transport system permease large protein [Nitratireductor pacificus pht-3B]